MDVDEQKRRGCGDEVRNCRIRSYSCQSTLKKFFVEFLCWTARWKLSFSVPNFILFFVLVVFTREITYYKVFLLICRTVGKKKSFVFFHTQWSLVGSVRCVNCLCSTSAVKIGATCLDLPLLWLPSFLLGSCALIPVAGSCLLCVFLIYKSIVL